jgi:membrane-bound ClpP family serine protease
VKGSGMADVWNTLTANFGGFDGFTWTIMAIIMVGAAFMMPTMAEIVTATCGALFVFGFAVFLRSVLAAKDAKTVARADWQYALSLELRTVLVYAAVFCFAIAMIYAVRTASKQL